MLDVNFAQWSDAGRKREHNEDFAGHAAPSTPSEARTNGWLFVLADGVGGQALGEVASRTAVESVVAHFRRSVGGEPHASLLRRLVKAANQQVYEAGQSAGPGGVPMATTIVACALRYNEAVVAWVGDSRCYLIRHGQATALTRDHTVSAEQVRLGLISSKEGAESNHRHLLSRSLGNDLFVNVDVGAYQLLPGDVLLLCSDGLHNCLNGSDMGECARDGADLSAAARRLVELANERDGGDNITVQLIRIRSVERIGMYRGRPYKLR